MKSIRIALIACGLAVSAVMAQSPMRPGNWETTVQMEMPGMSMPATKTARCVTAAQLKDPVQSVPSTAPGCKMTNYMNNGSKVTWAMACKDMAGTGEMTFKGDDTYVGQINVTAPHAMVMKLSGKRLGDCTQ